MKKTLLTLTIINERIKKQQQQQQQNEKEMSWIELSWVGVELREKKEKNIYLFLNEWNDEWN